MMFYVVPNYIGDEIDRRLDAEIKLHPAAAKDREVLRGRLLDYVNEHGVIPYFSLAKKEPATALSPDEGAPK